MIKVWWFRVEWVMMFVFCWLGLMWGGWWIGRFGEYLVDLDVEFVGVDCFDGEYWYYDCG